MPATHNIHGPLVEIIDTVIRDILNLCQIANGVLKYKIPSDEWRAEYLKDKQSFILLNLTNIRYVMVSPRGEPYGIAALNQAVGIAIRLNSAIPLMRDKEHQRGVGIEAIAFIIDTVFDCIQTQITEDKEYRDAANREFMRGSHS